MANKNNTKVIRYLDGGDVCGFIFVVFVVVGSAAAAEAAVNADASIS